MGLLASFWMLTMLWSRLRSALMKVVLSPSVVTTGSITYFSSIVEELCPLLRCYYFGLLLKIYCWAKLIESKLLVKPFKAELKILLRSRPTVTGLLWIIPALLLYKIYDVSVIVLDRGWLLAWKLMALYIIWSSLKTELSSSPSPFIPSLKALFSMYSIFAFLLI